MILMDLLSLKTTTPSNNSKVLEGLNYNQAMLNFP
jgi:hypothetical protein